MQRAVSVDRALKRLLRADQIDTTVDARVTHSRGESCSVEALPDVVLYPESTADVESIVEFARKHVLPIVPVGAKTSLEGHTVPIQGGLSVNLTRMNRILGVAAADQVAIVQPGVTPVQLNEHLRHTGLFLPLDLGAEATLGGMASTNASGTLAVGYGMTRRYVAALEVVLGTGVAIRTGTVARKSSSGYALTPLFCGAEGTLGVITELTLRLAQRPPAVSGGWYAFADLPSSVQFAVDLISSGLPIARCELADASTMNAVCRFTGYDLPKADTVFIEIHGEPESMPRHAHVAHSVAQDNGATSSSYALEVEDLGAAWRGRHLAYHALRAENPDRANLITDIAVPISQLQSFIVRATRSVTESGANHYLLGHIGDGNIHITMFYDAHEPGATARVDRAHEELVTIALSAGGTCTGEHGIGLRKLQYMRLEHGATLDTMWAIKNALDPLGIMNPGKTLPLLPRSNAAAHVT